MGYLDENWQQILDYEFCTRVGTRFPTVCVPRTLARFRNHPASKTRSQFEGTARELIHFFENFSSDRIPERELEMIKRTALSRVHYELALGYLPQERLETRKVLRHVVQSVLLEPRFALGRPLLTAHIAKQVVIDCLRPVVGHVRNLGMRRSSWEAR